MPKVAVLGSVNHDLSLRVVRHPGPGETVLATAAEWTPGGKGANQAAAAARCGAQVEFFGRVGDDGAGEALRRALAAEGIGVDFLVASPGLATGIAVVTVAEGGENSIVVAPGANAALTLSDADTVVSRLSDGDILLAQLEIGYDVVTRAFERAPAGVLRVLNAAPARPLDEVLGHVDLLVVNEHEALEIFGTAVTTVEQAADAAASLAQRHQLGVIITCGSAGSAMAWRDEVVAIPAHRVTPVDTTGAGDGYVGALCAALWRGQVPLSALSYASVAGALATTRPGALLALPTHGEIQKEISSITQ